MIKIESGDLFQTDCDVIAHQVNCMGIMGSGVAKQVKLQFPKVYEYYNKLCSEENYSPTLLGRILLVDCGSKYVANLFSQYDYKGCSVYSKLNNYLLDPKSPLVAVRINESRYTNYEALYSSLLLLSRTMKSYELKSVAFPFNIGCDRGGGNWNIVYSIINEIFKDFNVKLYKL